MTEVFFTAFATLFVMIDPIGVTPLFAALTAGASFRARAILAVRGVLIGGALLCLFGLVGDAALTGIGVSVPAFRIAGGLMLFLLAVDMLFEKRSERRERTASEDRDDPSVFPLATPLIAGPGALTAMILLTAEHQDDIAAEAVVFAALAAVLAVSLLMLLTAGLIERVLGAVGIKVVTRLLGMLLSALAVQFVLDGLRDFGAIG